MIFDGGEEFIHTNRTSADAKKSRYLLLTKNVRYKFFISLKVAYGQFVIFKGTCNKEYENSFETY